MTRGQLVVIDVAGQSVALHVDIVTGTRIYESSQLRELEGDRAQISAVLLFGEELVSLLRPMHLLNAAVMATLRPFLPATRTSEKTQDVTLAPLLEVRLGHELVAVPLDQVEAVSDAGDFEPLSHGNNALLSGAVQIKGEIFPVVDIGALLQCQGHTSLAQQKPEQRRAWIIVAHDNTNWAIPAAEARQIQYVDVGQIEALEGQQQRFIHAIAHCQDSLLPVLSLSALSQHASAALDLPETTQFAAGANR